MPIVIVDDRLVVMTSGHVLSCVLYRRDSGHIVNRLCAIQCGNPGPEIPNYVQTGRIHRIEQRRKPTAVTIDDGRIFPGCAAFRALAQVTAPSTLTSPNSQSTTPAPSGLLPFTSIWTCGMPGNLANPAADHSYFPLIYPATRSVPWIGMSVGV